MRRESHQFGLGLAEFEVRHSGRDDLDTDEKFSPKFKRYMQSQKDVRGKRCEKVQLTVKCRHEDVQGVGG